MVTDSICDEVDQMPTTFEGMKALSESFIKRALWGLLIESSDRKILQAPYGRPMQPTPLINLSEFLKNGGLDESDATDTNDEPEFCYDYGFDPLQYIADYLKNLHPDNIRRLKEGRIAIVNRLTLRANHARKVINNFRDLKCLTKRLRSGILWGPLTSPFPHTASSSSTIMCACKVVKKGNLIVELSKDPNFDNLENSWNIIVNDESITQKVKMTDVDPGTNYFIRCFLKEMETAVGTSMSTLKTRFRSDSEPTVDGSSSGSFEGEHCFFEHSHFTSIPVEEENRIDISASPVGKIRIVVVNISSALLSTTSILDEKESLDDTFLITCLLGEVFSAPAVLSKALSRDDSYDEPDYSEVYSKQSFDLHRYSESFNDPDSVLRNGLLLLAWHDLSMNSDTRLNDEEVSIKKHLTDVKKYNSKCGKMKVNKSHHKLAEGSAEIPPVPPRLRSFKTSPELAEVLQALPIECSDRTDKSIARQLYSTSMIGLHVQLFVLDHRRGYMGKDQVAWLTDALESSTARFKIIVTGTPFGMSIVDTEPLNGGYGQRPLRRSFVDSSLVTAAAGANADDSLDDAECNDDRMASESTDAFVKSKDSTDVGVPAPASVSMQLTPPILALGRDDGGRLNLSLSAIIAAYQLTCIRRKTEKMHVDVEVNLSDSATFAQDSLAPRPNRKLYTSGCAEEDNTSQDERLCSIELESGLLILSAGTCVPNIDQRPATDLDNRKRNSTANRDGSKEAQRRATTGSKSADPDVFLSDGVVSPFAATYDPKGTGRPYCFELCVGGGEGMGSGSGSGGSYSPVAIPALGAELLYTAPKMPPIETSSDQSAPAIDTYSAVVTLSDDGHSLGLQLLSLRPSQRHSVVFNCKLTVPSK